MTTRTLQDVLGVIRDLQAELSRTRSHMAAEPQRARLREVAQARIQAPNEVLEWARRDRRWSFRLAEVLRDPTERARELATRLVLAIVDELEQERETLLEREVLGEEPNRSRSEVTGVTSSASLFATAD